LVNNKIQFEKLTLTGLKFQKKGGRGRKKKERKKKEERKTGR